MTAVLFLHGQPGSARDWDRVLAVLGDRVSAIAIDRPGWDGVSRAGGVAHSGEAGVAALDRAGAERAVVVGLSFGGAVAAWIAVHHPERVAAVVLVSPAVNSASLAPVDRLLAAPVVGYAASAAILSGAALALASRRIRSYLQSTYSLPDEYLRAASRRFRGKSAWDAFVIEQRALLRELPELEARLDQIAAPTTIVIGTADAIVPPRAGRLLAQQIPGARLVEVDHGHHVLTAEDPKRVAEAILAAAGVQPVA